MITSNLEDQVRSFVAHEFPCDAPIEALKAFAIVARTNLLYNTELQFNATSNDAINLAVSSTDGIVLCFEKSPINAMYCNNNGGEIRSGGEPYMYPRKDPWDNSIMKSPSSRGIGLSKQGSIFAAKRGATFYTILVFYYPRTGLYYDYGSGNKLLTARPVLTYRDSGKDVADLQGLLLNKGFHLKVTGMFDEDTLRQVKEFQKQSKTLSDGVVSLQTWKSLLK